MFDFLHNNFSSDMINIITGTSFVLAFLFMLVGRILIGIPLMIITGLLFSYIMGSFTHSLPMTFFIASFVVTLIGVMTKGTFRFN